MTPRHQHLWQCHALDRVLLALAHSDALRPALIFKGARILNLHLGELRRQSNDIDCNVALATFQQHDDLDSLAAWLQSELAAALTSGLQRDSQRFALQAVHLRRRPLQNHPRGWDGFKIRVQLSDAQHPAQGLPALDLDITTPEPLGPTAVQRMPLGDGHIQVCSLSRVAGEKLRAFLSSLPAYRRKLGLQPMRVRCKDIYDISRILGQRPISANPEFWRQASAELRLAAAARFIDCDGLATFEDELQATRTRYLLSSTVPEDISFERAWAGLREVVGFFEAEGFPPMRAPLPVLGHDGG